MPVTVFALLLASLGSAGSVLAQYRPPEPLPEPIPPPDPVPSPTPDAEGQAPGTAVGASRAVKRLGWTWEPGFGLDGGWEQNIGFARPAAPDDIFGAATASLACVRRGSRSKFQLKLLGVGYAYRDAKTRNRVDAFVDVSAQGPLSPRMEGRLSGAYSFAHTDSETALVDNGILLPLDRTRTAGGGGDLTWRAAERTSVSVSGSGFYTDFESERYLDTTYLVGTFSLRQRVSRRDDVSINANLQLTQDDLSTRQFPAFYAGYGHLFGSSLRLALAGGAAKDDAFYTPGVPPPWTFFGSAGLSGRIRRSTLSLSYERGLQPLIGLGVSTVTDTFDVGLNLPIGRRLQLLTNGTFALRSNPEAEGSNLEWDAYFGASIALSERVLMACGYRFRRREDLLGMVSNDRATVSLAYSGRPR